MSELILVVEDDPGVRTTIVTFLEMEGYTVEAVSSTREALARLSQRVYPLVISDIYIDDRTGIDVLMAAKKQDANCLVILMNLILQQLILLQMNKSMEKYAYQY